MKTVHLLLLVGYGIVFILIMLAWEKQLRSSRLLKYLTVITFLIGAAGLLINKYGGESFTGGFFYVITYAGLRYLYLKIYQMEPTYNKSSWYDPEEGRKQNWLDVIVFVVPFFCGIFLPVTLIIIKSKMQ